VRQRKERQGEDQGKVRHRGKKAGKKTVEEARGEILRRERHGKR
jgi:hypothetical protein